MDADAFTDPVLELSLRHARKQRGEMALWLAVQVLMSDDVAMADDTLQDRLAVLQDRIENMMRVRLGLRDRDAGYQDGSTLTQELSGAARLPGGAWLCGV